MTRPNISSEKARKYLAFASTKYGIAIPTTVILGIRGYYLDSMGAPGKNDRGIYDDALVVVSQSVAAAFNGNTDPSAYKPGVASILPGAYPYRRGNHGISKPGGGYPAFRPATPGEAIPCTRDGVRSPKPAIAANIHKGGRNGTSSLACQTIHPDQWEAFYAVATGEMKRGELKEILYVLVEETAFRAGK